MAQPAILSGDAHAQWNAARNASAVFDISDRGQVELSGPDAVAVLHNLCTNDIKNLAAGNGCEFFLTNNKARVMGHGFALRLLPAEPPRLWLDLAPGTAAKVAAHLNHFIVSEQVEVTDRTGTVAQLHLCGPQSTQILNSVLPGVPALEPLQHVWVDALRVARNDRLGLLGYDLVCPPADAQGLGQRLIEAGAARAGQETFNILRNEAGVPVDGVDIDDDRFAVEVGRTRQAISYTKGCYLGQEPIVMARDRGHVNRMLLGLKVDSKEPVAAGTKVTRNGEEVGHVTSSVWSPLVGSVIALAYLKRGSQEPGTAVEVGSQTAVVASLPFTATQ
jgi:folate-binding protein YgfZ